MGLSPSMRRYCMPAWCRLLMSRVDDTGARHAHANFYTTQIDGEHFTVFRTTKSKSRLYFLSLLRGNYQDYVLNDAAFGYLEDRRVDPALAAELRGVAPRHFCNQVPYME